MCITKPVGLKQHNDPLDVLSVQLMLNFWLKAKKRDPIGATGKADTAFFNTLELFFVENDLVEKVGGMPSFALLPPVPSAPGQQTTFSLASFAGATFASQPFPAAQSAGPATFLFAPPAPAPKSPVPCIVQPSEKQGEAVGYGGALLALQRFCPAVNMPEDLTAEIIRLIIIEAPPDRIETLLPILTAMFRTYEIASPLQMAHFLSQMAVETWQLKKPKEVGSNDYFNRYEPGTTAGDNLGNTEEGDGKLFRGRGLLHMTGRDNYERYSKYRKKRGMGIDITSDEAAADAVSNDWRIGADSAGWYWRYCHGAARDANGPASRRNVADVCHAINGGSNGLPERTRYFKRADFAMLSATVP